MHLVALCLDSENIIGFSELTSNENILIAGVGYGCVMHSTLMEDNYTSFIIYGRAFHIHGKAFQ